MGCGGMAIHTLYPALHRPGPHLARPQMLYPHPLSASLWGPCPDGKALRSLWVASDREMGTPPPGSEDVSGRGAMDAPSDWLVVMSWATRGGSPVVAPGQAPAPSLRPA